MIDLREAWEEASIRIGAASHVLVLLDYDGTLVPIAERPERATLSSAGRDVLTGLRDLAGVSVGIVSGRALGDLAARVSLDGLWYVGNHGYEIRPSGGADVRFYAAEDVRCLEAVRDEIAQRTFGIPGVFLEPKGPILAVHFRQVDPVRVGEVERAVLDVIERHRDRVQMGNGKAVLEVRLRAPWTKGSAVRFLRCRFPVDALVLYFGDDTTDEDAFRELRDVGLTVKVGNPESSIAHFTLPDPPAVLGMLSRLYRVRRDRTSSTEKRRPE